MFSLEPREEIKDFRKTPEYQLAFAVINCLNPKQLTFYDRDIIIAVPSSEIPFNSESLRLHYPQFERYGSNLVTEETVLSYSFAHPQSTKRELTSLCDVSCIWFTDPTGKRILGRDEDIPRHLIKPETHGFRLIQSELFKEGLSSKLLTYETFFRTGDVAGEDLINTERMPAA